MSACEVGKRKNNDLKRLLIWRRGGEIEYISFKTEMTSNSVFIVLSRVRMESPRSETAKLILGFIN